MHGESHMLAFSMDGIMPRLLGKISWFQGGNIGYLLIPEYIGKSLFVRQKSFLSFFIFVRFLV
jgi:hypothetical protein